MILLADIGANRCSWNIEAKLKVRNLSKIESAFAGISGLFLVLRSTIVSYIPVGVLLALVVLWAYLATFTVSSSIGQSTAANLFIILFVAAAIFFGVLYVYERIIVSALNLKKWAITLLFLYWFLHILPLTFVTFINISEAIRLSAYLFSITALLIYVLYVCLALFLSAKLLQLLTIKSRSMRRLLASPQPSVFTWAGLTRVIELPSYFLLLERRVKRIFLIMCLSAVFMAVPPLLIISFPWVLIQTLNEAVATAKSFGDHQHMNEMAFGVLIVFLILGPLIIGICLLIGAALRRLGRNLLTIGLTEMRNYDGRRPVFFLRAFQDDLVMLNENKGSLAARILRFGRPQESLDHILLEEGSIVGPVVALGSPADGGRAPFGIPRAYKSGEEWMQEVEDLMHKSRAIVIVLENADGIWLEVRKIISRGYFHKTIFVIHPSYSSSTQASLILEKFIRISDQCGSTAFQGIETYLRKSSKRQLIGFHFNSGSELRIYESGTFSWISAIILLRVFFSSNRFRSVAKDREHFHA